MKAPARYGSRFCTNSALYRTASRSERVATRRGMVSLSMQNRRQFLGAIAATALGAKDYPVRAAKVEPLYKSPDGHPNGLETTPEGLWVGEQVTDTAYLLDWKSGKVLRKVETESSNTSGIAFGGG